MQPVTLSHDFLIRLPWMLLLVGVITFFLVFFLSSFSLLPDENQLAYFFTRTCYPQVVSIPISTYALGFKAVPQCNLE